MDDLSQDLTPRPNIVVLLGGKRKCGKDFIGNRLKSLYGDDCVLLQLSEPIKRHFSELYGIKLKELMSDSSTKEKIRQEMISWGENQREDVSPHVFCEEVVASVRVPARIWVVTDCRRLSDLEFFYSHYGDCLISVRISASILVRISRGFVFIASVDNSESECGLDSYNNWDLQIENNCTHYPEVIKSWDDHPPVYCSFKNGLQRLITLINGKLKI